MIKRIGLLAITFLYLPISASAAVINIEYSGKVSSLWGNGLGYNYGDSVNGSLTIDLSKSAGDQYAAADKAMHFTPSTHDMVTGYLTENKGVPQDFVDIYNNSRVNYLGELEDYLGVHDADLWYRPNGYDTQLASLQLSFLFKGYDWLTSDTLDNFSINTQDLFTLGSSFGVFSNRYSTKNALGEFDIVIDAAFFNFDSVKISSVPESGTLALLLIGGLGLFFRRRVAVDANRFSRA